MRKIPFEIDFLDKAVGGYPIGKVILFYGRAGSGKTHFAVYHPIFQLLKYRPAILAKPSKNKLVIISADKSVDYDRIEQLAEMHNVDINMLWEILHIIEVNTWKELYQAVRHDLVDLVKNQNQQIHMIAIDPINNLYRRVLLKTEGKQMRPVAKRLQGELEEMFAVIFAITHKFDGIITMTSWQKNGDVEVKPGDWYKEIYGGIGISHYVDVALKLTILSRRPKVVKCEIVKNRLGEEGIIGKIKITKEGIKVMSNGS